MKGDKVRRVLAVVRLVAVVCFGVGMIAAVIEGDFERATFWLLMMIADELFHRRPMMPQMVVHPVLLQVEKEEQDA